VKAVPQDGPVYVLTVLFRYFSVFGSTQ